MDNRPIIGITTQTLDAIPDQLPRCWVMSQRYVQMLVTVGAVPWVIPLLAGDEATLRGIYEQIDGLFLPGGVDVDPSAYGEARGPHCQRTDPARDWTELLLVRWALADGKPVPAAIKHDYFPIGGRRRDERTHDVRIAAGSRLARLLETEALSVNSMHHQGIARLAPGLAAVATSPDGLIEGVEANDGPFVLGVQWHPEDLVEVDPRMRRLFEGFITAAAP